MAYFSAEKFESTPNPPGFPWTHPLLPSGTEGVWKFACCFRAGFPQIFLRSQSMADMQAQGIAVTEIRLSWPTHAQGSAESPHWQCIGFTAPDAG